MRGFSIDIDVAAEDTDGYANDDDSGNGGTVTLITTSPGDGLAHKVVITPSGSVSGNYTLVGTDADGKSISETLATSTTNAVTSSAYFATLTSVTNATVGSETIDVGWADEVATKTYPLDVYRPYPPTVQVDVTGTIAFDIEYTMSDVQASNTGQNNFVWANDANFTNKSADLTDDLSLPGYRAIRIVVNSYSSGAEMQAYFNFPY